MKSGKERLNVLIILIAMCFPSAIALADEGAHKTHRGYDGFRILFTSFNPSVRFRRAADLFSLPILS